MSAEPTHRLSPLRAALKTEGGDGISGFYDSTLKRRELEAYRQWQDQAQAVLDEAIELRGADRMIREQATDKLAQLRGEIHALNDAPRIDVGDLDLPEPVVPEAELPGGRNTPVVDSPWAFTEQCRALIDAKSYLYGGGKS